MLALANEDELEHVSQLNEAKLLLSQLSNKQDVSELQERYDLLRGLVYWQIAEDYVPRQWELKKGLRELDEAIAKTRSSDASLKNAWHKAPASFEGYAQRIKAQNARIRTLQSKVKQAMQQQERHIQAIARREIQRQQQRIESYLVRARFAQARLYDNLARVDE